MPIPKYGVLRGRPDRAQRENDPKSPHYQIRVTDTAGSLWRVPVNVLSVEPKGAPKGFSEVLYYVDDGFDHPLLLDLKEVPLGFRALPDHKPGLALDYVRENYFDPSAMKHLPANGPGANDDLQDLVGMWTQNAMRSNADCFAFGSEWIGGAQEPIDKTFGTHNGVHDIHMNQGNFAPYEKDNGVYQDGGLLFFFPDTQRWVAIFLAFQSQAWHTDETTGDPLSDVPNPGPPAEVTDVEIVAALVNPKGPDPGKETVTVLNKSAQPVDLEGWSILDRQNQAEVIHGLVLAPGRSEVVKLGGRGAQLSNKGGTITLLDKSGKKVSGVSYTKNQVAIEGRTITF
jgi:uncharacterized protein YukJ